MRSPAPLLEIGKIFAEREGYLQPAIKAVEIVADHAATDRHCPFPIMLLIKSLIVGVKGDGRR
jgi:hypothetical protein